MIVQIVRAILDRLDAAGKADLLGYAFRTMDVYPRDCEAALVADPNRYPGVWCQFARFNTTGQPRSGAQVTGVFEMVVAAQHAGNQTKAREGNGKAEPGSVQLMEDVIGLLQGDRLGLEISGGLRVIGGEMASLPDETVKKGVSACVLQFTADFAFARGEPYFNETGEFIGDLRTIHTEWGRPAELLPVYTPNTATDLVTDQTLPIQESTS